MSSSIVTPALITAAKHLQGDKYYALCSFVMLTYDIFLTLDREVEKVWKKKFSGLSVLWFCNRWVFFLAVIPTIFSFQDPAFVGARIVIGSIFILRTYCIYNRSLKVAGVIALFLIVEVVVKLFTTIVWGQAVTLPPGFVACVLSVSPENAGKFIIYWVTELCTDAVVLGLTIYRSYTAFRTSGGFSHTHIWRVIIKDGIIYFLVMFGANLTTVLMYLTAAQDIKASNADFGVMINSLMTARLILNLKAAATTETADAKVEYSSGFEAAPPAWEANLLGNIGNEFEGTGSSTGSVHSTAYRSYKGRSTFDYSNEYELPVRRPGMIAR
ncbi:hypothetical protein M0805_007753 [Coniferiporia weirii]|nr:hypothetical protein M0805_007753 [Coniferiporia weirii]